MDTSTYNFLQVDSTSLTITKYLTSVQTKLHHKIAYNLQLTNQNAPQTDEHY